MKQLATALAFLTALVASLSLVRWTSDIEPASAGRDILHEKLAHLRSADERFDVVFVGNSHVYRTVNIEVFETEMATLGCSVEAYNLGVQGLTIAEQRVVLDAVAELPGGAPDYVVLGPTFRLRPVFEDLNDVSASSFYRARDMDDLFSTWSETELLRGRRLAEAAYVYGAAQLPYGALHHHLWSERIEVRTGPEFVAAVASNGYLSLESEARDRPETNDRRQTLRDFVESGEFELVIDPSREVPATPPVELARLQARLSGVRDSSPIVMLQPSVEYREMALLEEAWDGNAPVVNLAKPDRIPELLEPDSWFDRTHLTASTAILASRELASQLCPILTEDN